MVYAPQRVRYKPARHNRNIPPVRAAALQATSKKSGVVQDRKRQSRDFCTQCGSAVDSAHRFCASCGSKLD